MKSEFEKEFYKDCAEKKRITYGAHHKNRTGKGAVRLPSDYIPRKELKEFMNPAVLTEDLSSPMTLQSFGKLSEANKRTQLEIWGNVYGHTSPVISKLLGAGNSTGYYLLKKSGLTELFKEKYAEEKDDPEKRKRQKLRLAEVLGVDVISGQEPAEDAFEPKTASDVPADKNVIERRTEPPTVNVPEERPVRDSEKSGNLSMQISGRGDLIKMAMSAYLTQIDPNKSYVVQMSFCEL